jgi:hypothetical protein
MSCTQFQDKDFQGYIEEKVKISGKDMSFSKSFYSDSECKKATGGQSSRYEFKLGKEELNNGFNPKGTMRLRLTRPSGEVDIGLIWISEDQNKIRITKKTLINSKPLLDLFVYEIM